MLKKLALISAVSAFAVGTALAQQTNPPASSSSPSMTQESPKATDTTPKASDTGAKPQFIAAQKQDQWLASKFKGTDVMGSDNQKVGDVSDILFDKSGKIDAYV